MPSSFDILHLLKRQLQMEKGIPFVYYSFDPMKNLVDSCFRSSISIDQWRIQLFLLNKIDDFINFQQMTTKVGQLH